MRALAWRPARARKLASEVDDSREVNEDEEEAGDEEDRKSLWNLSGKYWFNDGFFSVVGEDGGYLADEELIWSDLWKVESV